MSVYPPFPQSMTDGLDTWGGKQKHNRVSQGRGEYEMGPNSITRIFKSSLNDPPLVDEVDLRTHQVIAAYVE